MPIARRHPGRTLVFAVLLAAVFALSLAEMLSNPALAAIGANTTPVPTYAWGWAYRF